MWIGGPFNLSEVCEVPLSNESAELSVGRLDCWKLDHSYDVGSSTLSLVVSAVSTEAGAAATLNAPRQSSLAAGPTDKGVENGH